MERQIEEEGRESVRGGAGLHSALTAHIVSIWSQLGSDWWHNYNMDMRYLHNAATIIHSRILFTEHMTSKHLIKHVVWTRILYEYNHYSGTSCKLSCNYRVWVHVISTWTIFLGFTETMWTFPWSLEFCWDVLGQNMERCCMSSIWMFLCAAIMSTFTLP